MKEKTINRVTNFMADYSKPLGRPDKQPDRQATRAGHKHEQPAPFAGHLTGRPDIAGQLSLIRQVSGRSPSRAVSLMRSLQQGYGNRHLQRVLAVAAKGDGGSEVSPEVENAIQSAKGNGQGLDSVLRSRMEPAFGADFSDVRVHTGTEANALSQALSARAFTTGRDIFFRDGEYNPGSSAGHELLAHELTHVVQQGGAVRGKLTVSSPGDAFEREAERFGRTVAMRAECLSPLADGCESAGKGKGTAIYQEVEEEGPVQRFSVESDEKKDRHSTGSGRGFLSDIQRDLATPEPALGPLKQPDLSGGQVREAILYNEGRYDAANTRRIQEIVGVEKTGRWDDAGVRAVASTQEEYRFKKDGMVGPQFFRFLSEELRAEGVATTTPSVLVMFATPGNVTAVHSQPLAGMHRLAGFFRVYAQFEERANCSQWEYRQFIRGTCNRTRGATVTDLKRAFGFLPEGELETTFQEDGDTSDTVVNYGHRANPADADPPDRYRRSTGVTDQRNGSIYECNDRPNIETPAIAGDTIDLNLQFRGEIQRNGATVETRLWNVRGHHVVT